MSLDRSGSLVPVDDDGSLLTGDVAGSSWVTLLLDRIDSQRSELTITLTGSQNNVSITSGGREADVLRCNNASDLTITGIAAPAWPGKLLIIQAVGGGHVFLAHQSASSSAANRLINIMTSANTPLAAGTGFAILAYDETTDRWRLITHEQGAPIAYTPTFSGTVGNATVSASYVVRGRVVEFQISMTWGSTTSLATTYTLSLPFTAAASAFPVGSATLVDSGTATFGALAYLGTTGVVHLYIGGSQASAAGQTVPFTWTTNDAVSLRGSYFVT